jgi:hypothetical protein
MVGAIGSESAEAHGVRAPGCWRTAPAKRAQASPAAHAAGCGAPINIRAGRDFRLAVRSDDAPSRGGVRLRAHFTARALKCAARTGAATCALAGILTACVTATQRTNSAPNDAAVALIAPAIAAEYRAIDDAAVEAYIATSLVHHMQPSGSQPCLMTDNSLSRRVSPLANPPLAETSIAQRARLAETLAAYESALASFTDGSPQVAREIATADLQRAASRFSEAAQAHAQGDLFVEDIAATLGTVSGRLDNVRGRDELRQFVREENPAIVKMLSILGDDVSRKHAEALGASHAAIARWLGYYDAARAGASTNAGPAQDRSAALPRCYEPFVSSADTSPVVDRAVTDGAVFPGRSTILARLRAAEERDSALRAGDPRPVVAALAALNNRLATAVASSAKSSASDEFARFRATLQTFAAACEPLERSSR